MKETSTWRSQRLDREITLVRWGHLGTPVLIFPTAGGDAEEIERFHVIRCLMPLLEQGRIKIYSCDSAAGQALVKGEGTAEYRGRMQERFQEYVFHEVVPAIRADCRSDEIEIIAAGASIGAFNSLAVVCRYPSAFSHALCLSGTFDLTRFLDGGNPGPAFYQSSPVHYVPRLSDGHLDAVRKRFVLFASGEGRAEDIGESWRAAHILGAAGIPNRVDSWGPEWHHDWPTWREMLPKYLGEMTAPPTV
jgi:esterase/lipase superfamily enzyme